MRYDDACNFAAGIRGGGRHPGPRRGGTLAERTIGTARPVAGQFRRGTRARARRRGGRNAPQQVTVAGEPSIPTGVVVIDRF